MEAIFYHGQLGYHVCQISNCYLSVTIQVGGADGHDCLDLRLIRNHSGVVEDRPAFGHEKSPTDREVDGAILSVFYQLRRATVLVPLGPVNMPFSGSPFSFVVTIGRAPLPPVYWKGC